jgi:3-dehydroquinate dehydratase type I
MEIFIRDFRVGDFPLITGILTDRDYRQTDKNLLNAVDILELRVDMFASTAPANVRKTFMEVRELFNKPVIATVRATGEGGEKEVPNRLDIYRSIIPLSDVTDVEINSDSLFKEVRKLCTTFKKVLIGSYHNFDETPGAATLEKIVKKGFDSGADLIKIALKANSRSDLLDLLSFALEKKSSRLIVISMGDKGLPSRILAPVIGSPITYGYINTPSAPGQFSVVDMLSMFRKLKMR